MTTETHIIRNPNPTGGSFIEAPITADIPKGYVPFGAIPAFRRNSDYLYRDEQAGYPALYRRSDGMVVARDRITADESSRILWSEKALTHIFVWAPNA